MLRRIIKKIINKLTDSPNSPTSPPPPSPTPVEEDKGSQMANIECGAQELFERTEAGESVVIVDVRESFELEESGMLEGAYHIPMRELPTRWEELKDADEIVCYCAAGARSYNAAMFLREQGLFNATSMEGGIAAWKAINAPTVRFQAPQ